MGLSFNHNSTIREFDWETVNQEMELFCLQNAVPTAKAFSFQLVIEELVTNIIKYGKCTDGNEIIKIEASIHEDRINLTISDNTAAFNPLETKTPDTELPIEERKIGGLGLVLVKQKTKSISYEYVNWFNIVNAEF